MKTGNGTKIRRVGRVLVLAGVTLLPWSGRGAASDGPTVPDGWTATAPREEIRPEFSREPEGDAGFGTLVIRGGREGVDGCWTKTVPVIGGKTYRFQASFRAKGIALPRRSVVAEIHWR